MPKISVNCRASKMFLRAPNTWVLLLFALATWLHSASASTSTSAHDPRVHHRLQVVIDPNAQTLSVIDDITLNHGAGVTFTLHAGLQPHSSTPGVTLEKLAVTQDDGQFEVYRVSLPEGGDSFSLRYAGRISRDFRSRTESPGRQQQLLDGTISADGVFLSGSVAWYPVIDHALATFELDVTLPKGWVAISQGRGPLTHSDEQHARFSWVSDHPQDDIYLIAGRYQVYRQQSTGVDAQVYLLQPDEALARRYLDVTGHYIDLYARLIGEYPYAKFAMVENFWETGYGMPSFTLLGSRVIRLPFILHSSYPHEILHNWWGNSVYVDYPRGNWAEGLTAYLADHLIKEQQGQGIMHRRTSLQRFAAFVRDDNDFTLAEFRSRHSGSSQAVGYDKAMMLFHMLRRKLGDRSFIEGLRALYRDQRFKLTSYADLQQAFEQASGQQLDDFFAQWLQRTGLPALEIVASDYRPGEQGGELSLRLRQTQHAEPFVIDVPVNIYLADGREALSTTLSMHQREQAFDIHLDAPPIRLEVDPWLDVFRRLHASESPPVLSELFGSPRMLFVLPASAPAELLSAYRQLVSQWRAGYDDVTVVLDSELDELPTDTALWIIGWQNRWSGALFESLDRQQFNPTDDTITLSGTVFSRHDHSFVLTRRNPGGSVQGWLATTDVDAIAGLTRKLPHYGRYSYLAFAGKRPDIQHKGQWPVSDSALSKNFSAAGKQLQTLQPAPLWPAAN
jgi:aminopeptidase N